MVDVSRILALALTAFAIIAVPGPSVLFVISRGVTLGRRAGLATVFGNAGGLAVQVLAVAAGLGTIVERSITVFTVIKFCGALYLVYLGVQAIRHRSELADTLSASRSDGAAVGGPSASGRDSSLDRRSLGQGLTVGLTNPKTLVFLSSLLPQFVDPALAPQPQIVALGGVFAAMALVGDSVWALVAGRARDWFARSPRRLGRLGAGGGALMIGLGLSVAAAGRPNA